MEDSVSLLEALLRGARKLILGKNRVKISARSELWISGIFKKWCSAAETVPESRENREKQRRRDPISEGLPPSGSHGGQGPEGEPFSHLGEGQGRRRRGALSPSLPVAPERRRGNHRHGDHLHQLRRHHHHHLRPSPMQRCTLSHPAVIPT